MLQVLIQKTQPDGAQTLCSTITFDPVATPLFSVTGTAWPLRWLLQGVDETDAAAVQVALEAAPERFDGTHLRAVIQSPPLTGAKAMELLGIPPTELEAIKTAAPDLDALAAAIVAQASGKATADDVRRELLEPWSVSTFGTPEANQLQKVAARTFGFPDPPGTEELKINWQLLYPMGALYNLTQAYLKQRGFREWQTVPVYRPYMPTEARPKQWQKGDEVRIKLLPLTSWTLDINEAAKVAEFLGAPGSPALVLKTFIPIRSVASLPQTGIGIPGTAEVVLAGGEYEALVELRYG